MSSAFPTFERWARQLAAAAPRSSPPQGLALRLAWTATAVGAAGVAAGLIYALAAPIGPLGVPPPQAAAAQGAPDLAVFERFEPFFRTQPQPGAAGPTVASLKLTLHALRRDGDGSGGTAILARDGEAQRSYAVGEEVAPGVTLQGIGTDHVVLRRGAELLQLGFGQPGGPPASVLPMHAGAAAAALIPPPGTAVAVDVAALMGALSVEPRREGGRVTGFQVSTAGPSPAVSASGLQDGDVVVAIDGVEVDDWEQFEDLARNLPQQNEASIVVERGGQRQTLRWRYQAPG